VNLSFAAFGVILTAVFGGGAVTVALINAVVGRGGRRADVAQKITEAAGGIIERLEEELERLDEVQEKCNKCNARLVIVARRLEDSEEAHLKTKAALRAFIRVVESNDPAATAQAISEVKRLI
jgi:hypothetical protein